MSWENILKIDITMNWEDVIKTSLQDLFNKLTTSQKQEVNNHINGGTPAKQAIDIIHAKYGLGRYANKPQRTGMPSDRRPDGRRWGN